MKPIKQLSPEDRAVCVKERRYRRLLIDIESMIQDFLSGRISYCVGVIGNNESIGEVMVGQITYSPVHAGFIVILGHPSFDPCKPEVEIPPINFQMQTFDLGKYEKAVDTIVKIYKETAGTPGHTYVRGVALDAVHDLGETTRLNGYKSAFA